MSNINKDDSYTLYEDLHSLETSGVTLKIDGKISDADSIYQKITVCEPMSYMRDILFRDDTYTRNNIYEVHFDNINPPEKKMARRHNNNRRKKE